jgi:hypothetical protein
LSEENFNPHCCVTAAMVMGLSPHCKETATYLTVLASRGVMPPRRSINRVVNDLLASRDHTETHQFMKTMHSYGIFFDDPQYIALLKLCLQKKDETHALEVLSSVEAWCAPLTVEEAYDEVLAFFDEAGGLSKLAGLCGKLSYPSSINVAISLDDTAYAIQIIRKHLFNGDKIPLRSVKAISAALTKRTLDASCPEEEARKIEETVRSLIAGLIWNDLGEYSKWFLSWSVWEWCYPSDHPIRVRNMERLLLAITAGGIEPVQSMFCKAIGYKNGVDANLTREMESWRSKGRLKTLLALWSAVYISCSTGLLAPCADALKRSLPDAIEDTNRMLRERGRREWVAAAESGEREVTSIDDESLQFIWVHMLSEFHRLCLDKGQGRAAFLSCTAGSIRDVYETRFSDGVVLRSELLRSLGSGLNKPINADLQELLEGFRSDCRPVVLSCNNIMVARLAAMKEVKSASGEDSWASLNTAAEELIRTGEFNQKTITIVRTCSLGSQRPELWERFAALAARAAMDVHSKNTLGHRLLNSYYSAPNGISWTEGRQQWLGIVGADFSANHFQCGDYLEQSAFRFKDLMGKAVHVAGKVSPEAEEILDSMALTVSAQIACGHRPSIFTVFEVLKLILPDKVDQHPKPATFVNKILWFAEFLVNFNDFSKTKRCELNLAMNFLAFHGRRPEHEAAAQGILRLFQRSAGGLVRFSTGEVLYNCIVALRTVRAHSVVASVFHDAVLTRGWLDSLLFFHSSSMKAYLSSAYAGAATNPDQAEAIRANMNNVLARMEQLHCLNEADIFDYFCDACFEALEQKHSADSVLCQLMIMSYLERLLHMQLQQPDPNPPNKLAAYLRIKVQAELDAKAHPASNEAKTKRQQFVVNEKFNYIDTLKLKERVSQLLDILSCVVMKPEAYRELLVCRSLFKEMCKNRSPDYSS